MKDFIFVTGASGVGKTTLCNGLLAHYKTTCVEQHMIPEFISRDGKEQMTGELEELTCWENQVAMLKCFHKLGYKNIIASDIDDLRTADIPIVFKGTDYIIVKLISSDLSQIQKQMKNRPNNGLIDYELQEKMNDKNIKTGQSVGLVFSLSWFSRWWRGGCFLFWSNGLRSARARALFH